jgi:hypothetical protein
MGKAIEAFLSGKSGRIHWRVRLEKEIAHHEEVVKYDDRGPSKDFSTDKSCFKDTNWMAVRYYCRLFRETA